MENDNGPEIRFLPPMDQHSLTIIMPLMDPPYSANAIIVKNVLSRVTAADTLISLACNLLDDADHMHLAYALRALTVHLSTMEDTWRESIATTADGARAAHAADAARIAAALAEYQVNHFDSDMVQRMVIELNESLFEKLPFLVRDENGDVTTISEL